MTSTKYRNVVPLIKVVRSAIIDTYGDIGRTQERFSHWAVRGLKELQRTTLKKFVRKVLLPVNRNTMSATLPLDCESVTFAGIIDNDGRKVPMVSNNAIVDIEEVDEINPDVCSSCGQDKNICEEVYTSEEIHLVEIDGSVYEETVIKKLQPNGDYYEERITPVKDLTTGLIAMETSSRFVVNFDVLECGCMDTSSENVCKLREYCPDVYAAYYSTPCDPSCAALDLGGYKVFEETGVVALDENYPYTHIYIEYLGFLPKANGQYLVPEVAFEALVNWVYWKSVEKKSNVDRGTKRDAFDHFEMSRKNLHKNLNKASLANILYSTASTPRLVLNVGSSWYDCYRNNLDMMRRYKCRTAPSSDCSTAPQPQQVVSTVIRTEKTTNEIVFRKLKFSTNDAVATDVDGPVDYVTPLQETETILSVLEAGIKPNSANVQVDGVNLPEGEVDQLSYTIVYGVNGITITFNQGAEPEQKYVITYAKEITI